MIYPATDKNLGLYFRLNEQKAALNAKSLQTSHRYTNRNVSTVSMSQRLVNKGIFSSVAMERIRNSKEKKDMTQYSGSYNTTVTPLKLQ